MTYSSLFLGIIRSSQFLVLYLEKWVLWCYLSQRPYIIQSRESSSPTLKCAHANPPSHIEFKVRVKSFSYFSTFMLILMQKSLLFSFLRLFFLIQRQLKQLLLIFFTKCAILVFRWTYAVTSRDEPDSILFRIFLFRSMGEIQQV